MTGKPFSPACERNRDPILAVLREFFSDCRHVLEIGSGSGQHAVHFAAAMPWLDWQCSDRTEYLPGIRMWIEEAELANTPAPVELDVADARWPRAASDSGHFDAVFTANTLHIMGWAEVEAFFAGVGQVLDGRDMAPAATRAGSGAPSSGASRHLLPQAGEGLESGSVAAQEEPGSALRGNNSGVLVVYGPFNHGGAYSSDGNREFDGWLKARDPASGIRGFAAVDALAQAARLSLAGDIAMPANNRCLIWTRA